MFTKVVTTIQKRKIYKLVSTSIKYMVFERKLNQELERQVALAYLCGVDTGYIKQKWNVSDATTRLNIIGKRSHEWGDPLVEFYRQTIHWYKIRKAVHLYLTFNGQSEGFPNIDLIDRERDRPVYEAVDENIFAPRTRKVIEETNLERILSGPKQYTSPEEKLWIAVTGEKYNYYQQALELVAPLIYQRLREAYQQDKKLNIDAVYARVTNDIFELQRMGLSLIQNPKVMDYVKEIEERETQRFSEESRKVLATLTPKEEYILKMRFGIEDYGGSNTLEALGERFRVTRDRIRQIEAKALRKLRNPARAKALEALLDVFLKDKP